MKYKMTEDKKCAVLFSGGKDSCYTTYLTKQKGYQIACLISIFSENKESYMFHTPNIKLVEQQAKVMELPLIIQKTKGKKEEELEDLEKAIKLAKDKYNINAVVSGALASNYQKSRIEKICNKLDLECINPLWQKNEIDYLKELINNNFKVLIVGVFGYPLDKSYLGRIIDNKFIEEVKQLKEKYKIHPAGEGGEFETFVLDCPLFEKPLKVKSSKISGEKNSWKMNIKIN